MWATIGSILTTLLPFLIKLVLYIIEKKENADKLKEEMLKFIDAISKDVPIKLRERHIEQIKRIKEQLNNDKPI